MPDDKIIAEVMAAADGEIVGRIRLQKILYLLNQLGLGAESSFQYYHYGPYSKGLDDALDRAKALHGVVEVTRYRMADGAPFSVFHLDVPPSAGVVGNLSVADARKHISLMKTRTATVLELAATIHWLTFKEKVQDWRSELVRRKGAKTQHGRVDQAVSLLNELQLAPVQ